MNKLLLSIFFGGVCLISIDAVFSMDSRDLLESHGVPKVLRTGHSCASPLLDKHGRPATHLNFGNPRSDAELAILQILERILTQHGLQGNGKTP